MGSREDAAAGAAGWLLSLLAVILWLVFQSGWWVH